MKERKGRNKKESAESSNKIGRTRTITEEQREEKIGREGRREEEQTIIRRIRRIKDTEEIIRATNKRLREN